MNLYKVTQTTWTEIRAKDEDEARFKHQQSLLEDGECWTEWDIKLIKGQCDGVEDDYETNRENK